MDYQNDQLDLQAIQGVVNHDLRKKGKCAAVESLRRRGYTAMDSCIPGLTMFAAFDVKTNTAIYVSVRVKTFNPRFKMVDMPIPEKQDMIDYVAQQYKEKDSAVNLRYDLILIDNYAEGEARLSHYIDVYPISYQDVDEGCENNA